MRMFKYPLPVEGKAELMLPVGAVPRHVGWQSGFMTPQLVLWAEVEQGAQLERRVLYVITTGHMEIPSSDVNARYVGTAQFTGPGGEYVVHVYIEE